MPFLDNVRFNPTLGGTTDWVVSTVVTGYQLPSKANAKTGIPYTQYAADNSGNWEIAQGLLTISGGPVYTFARTTVLYNSLGSGTMPGQTGAGTKINFGTVPTVAVVQIADDIRGKPLVVFYAGQSNIQLSKTFAWAPSPNAFVWNNVIGTVGNGTAFVPLDSANIRLAEKFASDVADAFPGRVVYLINSSFSGQPISHWLTGTGAPDGYADGVSNVVAALAAIGVTKIDVFGWWQGEADTGPLNKSYITNFQTMMARWFTNTWFPQETPCIIHSLASVAINTGNTDLDHFNDMLTAVANIDTDKRRFIYGPSMPSATYWDASNLGHMTGQGYFSLGALTAANFLRGIGRNTIPNIVSEPATGKVILGNIGFSISGLLYNANGTGIVAPTVASGTNIHVMGANATLNLMYLDSYGNFSNYIGRRANGSFGTEAALAANDLITALGAQGHDGTAYSSLNASSINIHASENWTTGHHGTYQSFYNTITGSLVEVECIRLQPNQITFFGSTSGNIALTWPAAPGTITAALEDLSTLGGGWTTYVPVVTASSGTLGTTSATGRYKIIGKKTVLLQADVTITTIGSGAGNVIVSIPGGMTPVAATFTGTSREHAISGKSGAGFLAASGSTISLADSGAGSYISAGAVINLGIQFEIV